MEQNFKIASNLILISVALMVISFFVDPLLIRDSIAYVVLVTMVLLFLVMAFLVRKRYTWMKYVLLIIFGIGSIGMLADIKGFFQQNILQIITSCIQTLLQLGSIMILFMKPLKSMKHD